MNFPCATKHCVGLADCDGGECAVCAKGYRLAAVTNALVKCQRCHHVILAGERYQIQPDKSILHVKACKASTAVPLGSAANATKK